jgi:hypothetical protein
MILTTHPLLGSGQERVELYLYPLSGPSLLLRGNFTFILTCQIDWHLEHDTAASSVSFPGIIPFHFIIVVDIYIYIYIYIKSEYFTGYFRTEHCLRQYYVQNNKFKLNQHWYLWKDILKIILGTTYFVFHRHLLMPTWLLCCLNCQYSGKVVDGEAERVVGAKEASADILSLCSNISAYSHIISFQSV